MKQQTAVEWLVEQTRKQEWHSLQRGEMIEQAKQMEKEQHGTTWDKAIDAHEKRGHVIARSWCDFDEYYNEKFNK